MNDKRMPILSPDPASTGSGPDASGEYAALPARVSRTSEIRATETPKKLSFRYEQIQERTPAEERDHQDRQGRTMYAAFDLDTLDPAQAARFFVARLHAIAARLTKPVNDIGEAVDFAKERTELYELASAIEARLGHLEQVSAELDVVALQLDNILGLATLFFSRPADAERVKTFSDGVAEVRSKALEAMKKALEAPKKG